MRKILAVLLIICLFCSCTADTEKPEEENISFGESGFFVEEIPGIEENPGESCTLPEDIRKEKENEMPAPEDFIMINLYSSEGSPMIELTWNEYEKFQKLLQKDKWEPFPEDRPLHAEPFEPNNIFAGSDDFSAWVLYISSDGDYTLVRIKSDMLHKTERWLAPKEVAYDMEEFRLEICEAAANDGRWPFLSYEEEIYLENISEFDEEHFIKEFDVFISTVSGEHNIESQRLGIKEIGAYLKVKACEDAVLEENELSFDDDGRILVPEAEADRIAKYVFGIRSFSKHEPSENGFYAVPFDTFYINYRIENIETDGRYISCTVNYYDLGDAEYEEVLCQKVFRFISFEAEGETWYRPVSAWRVFGEGDYF